MRRLLLPMLLIVITAVLVLRTSTPVLAVGFGVVMYGGIGFVRQGLAGIQEREVILPRRYGLDFHFKGNAAVAQGWLRLSIGLILIVFAFTLGLTALSA